MGVRKFPQRQNRFMNPLLPVSSISQINDFENYFQLFFKIFYGSGIYRKRNKKELFFSYD